MVGTSRGKGFDSARGVGVPLKLMVFAKRTKPGVAPLQPGAAWMPDPKALIEMETRRIAPPLPQPPTPPVP